MCTARRPAIGHHCQFVCFSVGKPWKMGWAASISWPIVPDWQGKVPTDQKSVEKWQGTARRGAAMGGSRNTFFPAASAASASPGPSAATTSPGQAAAPSG